MTTLYQRIFLIVLIVACVVGCTPWTFDIVQDSNPQRPTFYLRKGYGPMPRSIVVEEMEGVGDKAMMWGLYIVEYEDVKTKEIVYGIVPKGMEQIMPPKELKKNVIYGLYGLYGDYVAKSSFFVLVEQEGRVMLREVDRGGN